jgi:ABC-type glutathione transport system ATPase component
MRLPTGSSGSSTRRPRRRGGQAGREHDPGAGLSKRYGPVLAVDGLSFDVLPGRVTGFLGPNGAGKPNIGF